jgi:hypothetical protein
VGSSETAPYDAQAFHPVLGRCRRFVSADGVGGQPVHCRSRWRGGDAGVVGLEALGQQFLDVAVREAAAARRS